MASQKWSGNSSSPVYHDVGSPDDPAVETAIRVTGIYNYNYYNGKNGTQLDGTINSDIMLLDKDHYGGPYFVDIRVFRGGAGNDVISMSSDVFSYGAVTIYGDSGFDTLIGNDGKDSIYGGTGDDVLKGYAGADDLRGDDGNDLLDGGRGADKIYGGAGSDTASYRSSETTVRANLANAAARNTGDAAGDVYSSIENIVGSNFKDKIEGNSVGNELTGLDGRDVIEGGGGSDVFIYENLHDSTVAGDGRDLILDFSRAQGDRIDLHLIDARSPSFDDDAFHFIGSKNFSHNYGELQAKIVGSSTIISGDVNADGKADFSITLHGVIDIHASDFVL